MKKQGMQKKAALLAAMLIVLFCIVAGCSSSARSGTSQNRSKAPSNASSDPPRELKISVISPMYTVDPRGTEVQKSWTEKMESYLNVTLNIDWQLVVYADYQDKARIQLGSGDIPDIMTVFPNELIISYGDRGLLLDIAPYLDRMPNYTKYVNGTAKEVIFTNEGKLYAFYDGRNNEIVAAQTTWGYRLDVFEDNGIKIPSTIDEFYEAARRLKAIYPSVYPVGGQGGRVNHWYLMVFSYVNHASAFNDTASTTTNTYDNGITWDGSKFAFGPMTEGYKDAVAFMARLYAEKLLDPEFLINTRDQSEQKCVTGQTFMTPATFGPRLEARNATEGFDGVWVGAMPVKNPKYGDPWAYNVPPKGDYLDPWSGLVVSSKSPEIDTILKMLDYQYDDEMIELINWGIEDVTFLRGANGNEYLPDIFERDDYLSELARLGVSSTLICRTGIQWVTQDTNSQYKLKKPMPYVVNGAVSYDYNYWLASAANGVERCINEERPLFVLTKEEQDFSSQILAPIYTFVEENAVNFITGKRSLSEWDSFISDISKYGDINKLVEIYNGHV